MDKKAKNSFDNYNSMPRDELIRIARSIDPDCFMICSPDNLREYILNKLAKYKNARQEHFFVVTLSASNRVIKVHMVTKGLANKTLVHPREVFLPAILDNATAIIIGHNHPSGNLVPSVDDVDCYRHLKEASNYLGIKIMDSFIFHGNRMITFSEEGLL